MLLWRIPRGILILTTFRGCTTPSKIWLISAIHTGVRLQSDFFTELYLISALSTRWYQPLERACVISSHLTARWRRWGWLGGTLWAKAALQEPWRLVLLFLWNEHKAVQGHGKCKHSTGSAALLPSSPVGGAETPILSSSLVKTDSRTEIYLISETDILSSSSSSQ